MREWPKVTFRIMPASVVTGESRIDRAVGDVSRSPHDMDLGTPIYANTVRFDTTIGQTVFDDAIRS